MLRLSFYYQFCRLWQHCPGNDCRARFLHPICHSGYSVHVIGDRRRRSNFCDSTVDIMEPLQTPHRADERKNQSIQTKQERAAEKQGQGGRPGA